MKIKIATLSIAATLTVMATASSAGGLGGLLFDPDNGIIRGDVGKFGRELSRVLTPFVQEGVVQGGAALGGYFGGAPGAALGGNLGRMLNGVARGGANPRPNATVNQPNQNRSAVGVPPMIGPGTYCVTHYRNFQGAPVTSWDNAQYRQADGRPCQSAHGIVGMIVNVGL